MLALVYNGPGRISLEDRLKPTIKMPTDAVVQMTKTTICGTDLHILEGNVATCTPGTVLGHEGVGVVNTVGPGVTHFKPGNRVLISPTTACGRCGPCRENKSSHCTTGGWILGNTIDGAQAEYVRIPYADTSLYPIPKDVEEEALVMLTDILPTGFECGVLDGKVQVGSSVAIVGSGPVGLAALLVAQVHSPSTIMMIDLDDNRLAVGVRFGATATVNCTDGNAVQQIMTLTGGRGVDMAIDSVGIPATFKLCQDIVTPSGTITKVGVRSGEVDLLIKSQGSRNVTITTRPMDTASISMRLKTVDAERIDAIPLITHRFKLDQIVLAYETFGKAADTVAMKVIIAT
jgi:alcohol dehydrogenase